MTIFGTFTGRIAAFLPAKPVIGRPHLRFLAVSELLGALLSATRCGRQWFKTVVLWFIWLLEVWDCSTLTGQLGSFGFELRALWLIWPLEV
jgi:hypothetical protein